MRFAGCFFFIKKCSGMVFVLWLYDSIISSHIARVQVNDEVYITRFGDKLSSKTS